MESDSSLSSLPSSDDESLQQPVIKKTLTLKGGKLGFAPAAPAPKGRKRTKVVPVPRLSPSPSPERETSPPHEYVLADNPDIAVLVMFRSRFAEAFNKTVPSLGPQDIEDGVVSEEPSEQVELFLCALLGLVLNRKKYVERGHHGRALEECVSTQKSQWPLSWNGANPLSGSRTFSNLTPSERINMLKTLTIWCLSSSEVITNTIKDSYKQTRHEDDVNQALSVQPWGVDGRKRRYWLIEGQNDTNFRLYRESAHKSTENTWWSLAGSVDELKAVGETLRTEGSQAARRLADRFNAAIPRLELSAEVMHNKRKKKEYRLARRAAFQRPEPGFSMYEGRTRGKKLKYTFSEDEESGTDASGLRRSTRHSSRDTPADPNAPTMTSSGRHVRSRFGRSYGDTIQDTSGSSVRGDDSEAPAPRADGRPRRSGRAQASTRDDYGSLDELDEEAEKTPSGEEWSGDENDLDGKDDDEIDDDVMSNDEDDISLMDEPKSLIVNLRYGKGGHSHKPNHEMKDSAISSAAGVSSDMTIGQALSSATSTTMAIEGPSAASELDAGLNKPKLESSTADVPMPDVPASTQAAQEQHQHPVSHPLAHGHSSAGLPPYHPAEHAPHYAPQVPAYLASPING